MAGRKAIQAKLSDGREVRVLFKHVKLNVPAVESRVIEGVVIGKVKVFDRFTECVVVTGPKEAETVLGWGQAWKSVEDQFNRAIGREFALKRALQNQDFDRASRGAILAAYYSRNKQPEKSEKTTNN